MEVVNSVFGKARGLMFSRKKNLMFVFDEEKRISLHMFFVFFPIDVLFLDKDKKIVEIKKNFKPFTFYKSKEKAKYVVEIAIGRDKEYKIKEKF
ncbi:DUF192 domain-containing protein [Candidatus Woesearchaeota archaeon]|nr:DUF192 domain-containing protein [Candidatus Woesearchaeota archaeon]